jgi:murein DD-endopeptidase MepM/ murein hydrolase activator NlpD
MGQAFTLRLSGPRAAEARVRFTSEVGEDVRQPAESLTPLGAAGEYRVLGRVVLGKATPVTYEIRLGDELLRGRITVVNPKSAGVVPLNLPPSIADKLKDPGRTAEEAAVERAYARRGAPVWDRPFAPAVSVKVIPGSFGQSRTYTKGGEVKYHYGADYPAPAGTQIRAINDGTVVLAGKYPVRGNMVAIDHGGGLISLYFHQSKLLVRVGQRVTRGQVIGQVGSTGLSQGAHLHLELRLRGEGTQPQDWMGKLWP